MIFLDIRGRCGNQMFQYAFARKISIINHNEELTIDFYDVVNDTVTDPPNEDELSHLNASKFFKKTVCGENKIEKYGSKWQFLLFRFCRTIERRINKSGTDKKKHFRNLLGKLLSIWGIYYYYIPKKIRRCKQQNKFIPIGYFENPTIFADIEEVLKNDFEPKDSIINRIELLDQIEKSESVCISLRKWDNDLIGQTRSICNMSYYLKAIEYLTTRIENPKFFVFSNNINWAKENFDFPEDTYFETGDNMIYEKMALMSACKHFIISNSTFAWWAQYLGKNDNKIVVCPEKWNLDEKTKNPLILSDFTIINSL